ncbi:neuronal pentraxin-2-like [Trichomycterus rosablanca]|uniref:neuronal pentraxin-2-like n=1 Tax=Trichomycterus rosablanca TaxID=2290929 RepID=UPI002F35C8D9
MLDGCILHLILSILLISVIPTRGVSGWDHDLSSNQRFICTPTPAHEPCLQSTDSGHHSGLHTRHYSSHHSGYHSRSGGTSRDVSDEAQSTILHLRESLVQQKETILDQRETIRELTAKLALCEGFGLGTHEHEYRNEHKNTHGDTQYGHHYSDKTTHDEKDMGVDMMSPSPSSSPEQMSHMLTTLNERLKHLQTQNTSTTYSASLKELLQRKISALEQQMLRFDTSINNGDHHHGDDDKDQDNGHNTGHLDNHKTKNKDYNDNHDNDEDGHHGEDHHNDDNQHHNGHQKNSHHDDNEDTRQDNPKVLQERKMAHNKLDEVLNHLTQTLPYAGQRKISKSSRSFQIGFPMSTNYMYGHVKRTLTREILGMTLCLWLKAGASSMGTPISYSAPGQANELVLIEWGGKPMELLIKDMAVTLPLSLHDGKWHHVCVVWSARDGVWEVYQDGLKRGSGENLNSWQPIKPGGVFILGQEQDSLGGRFDATQAFVGEMSDLQFWSRTLTHDDIYSLASCRSHMAGDVISWAESMVELHGGVTKYPFDPCH